MYLFIYLLIYLVIYIFIYLFIYLFVYLFIYAFMHLFMHLCIFVSPELSSGRDLVIQCLCSVRRVACGVRRPWFFVRSISRDPYDLPW